MDQIVAQLLHRADLVRLLEGMERTVFGHVADGVDAELPAQFRGLAHQRVDLFLRIDGVAVEARTLAVLAALHGGGERGRDAVERDLAAVQLQHVVAEAGHAVHLVQTAHVLFERAELRVKVEHEIGAVGQPTLLVRFVVVAHLVVVEVRVDGARDAEGVQALADALDALEMLIVVQRGLHGEHRHERAVLVQHAVQFAVVVMADLGALGLRRVLRVAHRFEGARVRGHGVGGHVQQDDRIVRGDFIKLAAPDQLGAVFPDELVPAVAFDPLAGRGVRDLLLQGVDDGLAAGHAVEVEVEHVLAGPLAVHVALDEAGGENPARGVDDLSVLAHVPIHVGRLAHGYDLAVLGGNAAVLDDGKVGFAFFHLVARDGDGVDLGMLDDQIGLGIPCLHAVPPHREPTLQQA